MLIGIVGSMACNADSQDEQGVVRLYRVGT